MSYDSVRQSEQMRLLEPDLHRFVQMFDPSAPTIFLFPGAMASGLWQAQTTVGAGGPPYGYDLEWVSMDTFCGGGADRLRMNGLQDANQRMTVASGTIGMFGVGPYQGFDAWCRVRTQPFNYLLVAWDWRLPLQNSVDFVMKTLLPAVQQRLAKQMMDLLASGYYFIGHSFGGMLVKLMLDAGGPFVTHMRKAITVATPFYGQGTFQHYFFSGFNYLNQFYSKSDISQVIATFPGPYSVLFLDETLFATVRAALAADPLYPLAAYPSKAMGMPSSDVDPYKSDSNRYPPWVDAGFLQSGMKTLHRVATLAASERAKLFHIRGVTTDGAGVPLPGTAASQQWSNLPKGFDPDTDADPISNPVPGAGDGVVPAWSARLVDSLPGHVIDVTGAIDHTTMMDDPAVLQHLSPLIDGAAQSVLLVEQEGLFRTMYGDPASEAETQSVLARLAAARRPSVLKQELDLIGPERLRPVARRMLRDFLKVPLGGAPVPAGRRPG